jgi:hypothetical protein
MGGNTSKNAINEQYNDLTIKNTYLTEQHDKLTKELDKCTSQHNDCKNEIVIIKKKLGRCDAKSMMSKIHTMTHKTFREDYNTINQNEPIKLNNEWVYKVTISGKEMVFSINELSTQQGDDLNLNVIVVNGSANYDSKEYPNNMFTIGLSTSEDKLKLSFKNPVLTIRQTSVSITEIGQFSATMGGKSKRIKKRSKKKKSVKKRSKKKKSVKKRSKKKK